MADISSLLTRCPHCDTRFRVTDEQLNVANGRVRCGHCMEVFDARSQSVAAKDPDRSVSSEAPHENFSASDPEDHLIFQDNPEEDSAEGHYAGHKVGFSEEELSDSFRDAGSPGSGSELADDEDRENVDESWAEAMLREELPDTPARTRRPPPESPSFNQEESEKTAPAPSPAASVEPQPEHPAPEAPTGQHDDAHSTDDLELAEFTASPPPGESPDDPAPRQQSVAGGTFPPLDDLSPYEQLSREPVPVKSRSSGLRGWLWTLIILALIGGLISQVAWFQVDRLAAIPELRPWYEKACEYAGCELEPLVAMDRIQSRKLVVRTDPDNRSALLVDAVIINQAEFEQPFPAIALTFSNLNGDVVAQSIFPPEDYLAGDGTDLSAMPSGTQVRISISIRDPGRDAVNYNLRFVNRRNGS